MNERARWRHRKALFGIIVGLIIGGLVLYSYRQLAAWAYRYYAVTSYVLVAQNLDDVTVGSIGAWLDEQKAAGTLGHPDCTALNAELTDRFPLVGFTSWSRYTPTCLTCTVRGVTPRFLINKQYVAGDNGRLYRARMFSIIPETLPAVSVNRLWLTPERFGCVYAFLVKASGGVLKSYECVYHDPHKVVLWPKDSLDLPHRCVCVVDDRTVSVLPDMVGLMNLCQAYQAEAGQRPEEAVSYFDFRFPGDVISKCISHREGAQLQRV